MTKNEDNKGSSFVLPADMQAWGAAHAHVIEDAKVHLSEKNLLSEDNLWALLAEKYSPAWASAKTRLIETDKSLHTHQRPENVPLGAIGRALDGGTITSIQNDNITALSAFTVINEELHQDKNLQRLFKILKKNMRMLERDVQAAQREHKSDATMTAIGAWAATRTADEERIQHQFQKNATNTPLSGFEKPRLTKDFLNGLIKGFLNGISTIQPAPKQQAGKPARKRRGKSPGH